MIRYFFFCNILREKFQGSSYSQVQGALPYETDGDARGLT